MTRSEAMNWIVPVWWRAENRTITLHKIDEDLLKFRDTVSFPHLI